MARKDGSTLKRRGKPADGLGQMMLELSTELHGGRQKAVQRASERSWAAVGIDTSLTACSAVAMGYDALTDKTKGPTWAEIRWMPDDDYYKRLGEAARGHELVLDVLANLWGVVPAKVYIACEEPFFFGVGAKTRQTGQWIKQQAEVAGAFKGSLARYGFLNIYEINNSQWHATLRKDGVEFERGSRDMDAKEKAAIRERNKFIVKAWAIRAFGLPEFPDLVKSKTGAKIPRPESGFGAKAKPEQPSDIYDAAACCAWMTDYVEENEAE